MLDTTTTTTTTNNNYYEIALCVPPPTRTHHTPTLYSITVAACAFIHTPISQCLMGVLPVTSYWCTLLMTNLSACSSSDDLLVKYSLLRIITP